MTVNCEVVTSPVQSVTRMRKVLSPGLSYVCVTEVPSSSKLGVPSKSHSTFVMRGSGAGSGGGSGKGVGVEVDVKVACWPSTGGFGATL